MRKIKLTKNKFAIVDDIDYEYLMQWKWHYSNGYAERRVRKAEGAIRHIRMHRIIIDAPNHLFVDHIDRNGLNNQRNNLRLCTSIENKRNVGKLCCNTSGFKGVAWHKLNNKFIANIRVNYKRIHLGYFKDAKEAAIAYDQAAKEYFGDFAALNFK